MCKRCYQRGRRRGTFSTGKVCNVEGCESNTYTAGLCHKHHARVLRHGSTDRFWPDSCTVEDCDHDHYGRGYCRAHFYRVKRYGDAAVRLRVRSYDGQVCRACERRPARARGFCKDCREWAKNNYAPDPNARQPKHLPIANIRRVISDEFPEYRDFAKAHGLDEDWFTDMMRSHHRKFIDWGTADRWCNYLGLHPVLVWPEEWQTFDTKVKSQRYKRLVAA